MVRRTRRVRQLPPSQFELPPTAFIRESVPDMLSPEAVQSARRSFIRRAALPQLKAQFSATKNPLFAWHAYWWARGAGLSIPKWVHDYLELAALNLWSMRGKPPRRRHVARAVADALGFVRDGCGSSRFGSFTVPQLPASNLQRQKDGAYNPFTQSNEFPIAFAVYAARVNGTKLVHAYEDAAAQHHVTRRTAERAWATYRAYFKKL